MIFTAVALFVIAWLCGEEDGPRFSLSRRLQAWAPL